MKILAVYGCAHDGGNTQLLAQTIAAAATAQGAEVEHFNVLKHEVPLFRTDRDFKDVPIVGEMRQKTAQADAFIVVSPEYHGCMSNAIKNFFDFHYQQFAGKAFAIATSTGGSMGVSCNSQMRIAIQHCHGWALPYQVGARSAEFSEGKIINEKVTDRLVRLGRDLVVYGSLLKQQFEQDKAYGSANEKANQADAGFAGWYV